MSKTGRKAEHLQRSRRRTHEWAMGAAALALVLTTAAFLALRPEPAPPVDDASDPSLGAANARVVVYYFGDFQCPACKRFETNVLANLERDVFSRSEARLVFKDFPILGEDSWRAAVASQAVWASTPSSYWAWHHGLYAMQGEERSGWASPENLVAYSRSVSGVDALAVATALDSGAARDEVELDKRQGEGAGVRSTPTLLIDGAILNANDEAAVRAAIQEALS